MILVDTALQQRQAEGRPIRVGIVGAGFMTQGLVNQIVHSTPGMRVVAVSNRNPERAVKVFQYAGLEDAVIAESQARLNEGSSRRETGGGRRRPAADAVRLRRRHRRDHRVGGVR